MADLRSTFAGIPSPNPFWLASAPPTDKAYNVERAFRAGWGGVVWKTLGEEGPPVVNVNGPRYGAIWGADRRLLGLNNIELITDRELQKNLQENSPFVFMFQNVAQTALRANVDGFISGPSFDQVFYRDVIKN